MLAKPFQRDAAIKLVCMLVLVVHGVSFGLTRQYLSAFVLYPILLGAFGFVLVVYRSPEREAAARAAEKFAPALLLKLRGHLTLISLALTTFVVLFDTYAGSFARFQWWPIVLGLWCGTSLGAVVRHSRRG